MVLRGRGIPHLRGRGRGDHRIVVNVLVPRKLTDEQRRLLQEFERRRRRRDLRAATSRFLGRLRAAFR